MNHTKRQVTRPTSAQTCLGRKGYKEHLLVAVNTDIEKAIRLLQNALYKAYALRTILEPEEMAIIEWKDTKCFAVGQPWLLVYEKQIVQAISNIEDIGWLQPLYHGPLVEDVPRLAHAMTDDELKRCAAKHRSNKLVKKELARRKAAARA